MTSTRDAVDAVAYRIEACASIARIFSSADKEKIQHLEVIKEFVTTMIEGEKILMESKNKNG